MEESSFFSNDIVDAAGKTLVAVDFVSVSDFIYEFKFITDRFIFIVQLWTIVFIEMAKRFDTVEVCAIITFK